MFDTFYDCEVKIKAGKFFYPVFIEWYVVHFCQAETLLGYLREPRHEASSSSP